MTFIFLFLECMTLMSDTDDDTTVLFTGNKEENYFQQAINWLNESGYNYGYYGQPIMIICKEAGTTKTLEADYFLNRY